MGDVCRLIWCLTAGLFRPRASLHAEILVLRHQLNVLQRKSPKRLVFNNIDRLVFASLYGLAPNVLDALKILKPETVVRWHGAGFRAYWRWKSRSRGGRPRASAEVRELIREMCLANALWGAPRIHGELLKLGIDVGQTTVAKYMTRTRRPPSQGWKTFLSNHADGIASMDMFVVPTASFRLLYGLLILQHARREKAADPRENPAFEPSRRNSELPIRTDLGLAASDRSGPCPWIKSLPDCCGGHDQVSVPLSSFSGFPTSRRGPEGKNDSRNR